MRQGKIVGVVLVFHDVTERRSNERARIDLLALERNARAEAEAISRMKDEFLLTVSHELRTPLNSILGWARLLTQGQLDQGTAGRALTSVLESAKTQARLIDDLLEVSRIVAGKLRLKLGPVALGAVVESAIETVRPAAAAKNIQLRTKLAPEPITVTGDADRLLQVIWNLLSNAIKFTPAGGAVEVALEQHDAEVKIGCATRGKALARSLCPTYSSGFAKPIAPARGALAAWA
jgi:signal transduction histidine kinase